MPLCWELNSVRQWNNDLGEKASSRSTQSQKLPAEGKPSEIPTTCYCSRVARDPCEAASHLTDPWPTQWPMVSSQGEAFPCPALLGQTIAKLALAREKRTGLPDTPPSNPRVVLHLDSVWARGTQWLQSLLHFSSLHCCLSIIHQREHPSYGLGEGGGCCSSSAAFVCFVLRVQLPKTQSHKTQFTIPAAFWHPSVLAHR